MAIAVAVGVSGQTFETRPGQLAHERNVPSNAAVITVRGAVDASDLDYLATAVVEADMLDLSAADIVAYKGKRVGVNTYSSPADVLPPYIFAGLKASHVRLPATLKSIGEGAFLDSRVEEVGIPAGVESIGADAFGQCDRLTCVELPAGVGEVAARTFEGCAMLGEVKLPGTVHTVGARAFLGCGSLKNVEMPASLTSLADEAFALSGLETVRFDGCDRLDSIGDRVFASCGQLLSAALPSGAVRLGEGVFFECRSLERVTLPAEAVAIPALTFKGAGSLGAIELPDGVTEIGALAMAGVSSVRNVVLPGSLGHIGDGAFEDCSGIGEIDARALGHVPALGSDVWAGVAQPGVALVVQPRLEDAFMAAPQWQDFAISRSSVTTIADKGGEKRIEAVFHGKTLAVTCSGALEGVTVYSIDGRMLAEAAGVGSDSVTIDTSRHAGPFFIVRVMTAGDSGVTVFKLMREP